MSTTVRIDVTCDNPDCLAGLRFERTNEGGLNTSSTLDWAKRRGWQVAGHRALCPSHRTVPLQLHEFVGGGYSGHQSENCSVVVGKGDRARACWQVASDAIHQVPS